MKKALIVSPYLDHLGGGERYMLSVAEVLEGLGFALNFAWDNLPEIQHLASMLGITLRSPGLAPAIKPLYFSHNPLAMYLATRPYDVVTYLSDGSLPLLGGRHNLVHLQVPFHGVGGHSWRNQLKKRLIHTVIVNSRFTKRIVDEEYGINSTVLYPPVIALPATTKEKVILSVGRFEPSLNAKKQDILISAFQKLSPQLSDWRLVLAGASASDDWVDHLRELAVGAPIDFAVNATYEDLCQLYATSAIYWHAAGFGIDEVKNPELTEHFGITTVEAISAGCLPLVVPKGGQTEIVTDARFHWQTVEELVDKTLSFVSDPPDLSSLNITSFTKASFSDQLQGIINL